MKKYVVILIRGLGSAGKSQLALDYTEQQRARYKPILWIYASDKAHGSLLDLVANIQQPGPKLETEPMWQPPFWDAVIQALVWVKNKVCLNIYRPFRSQITPSPEKLLDEPRVKWHITEWLGERSHGSYYEIKIITRNIDIN